MEDKMREMLGIHVHGIQIRGFHNQKEIDEYLSKNNLLSKEIRTFSYQEKVARSNPATDGTLLR
jgi:hypothetical protein